MLHVQSTELHIIIEVVRSSSIIRVECIHARVVVQCVTHILTERRGERAESGAVADTVCHGRQGALIAHYLCFST